MLLLETRWSAVDYSLVKLCMFIGKRFYLGTRPSYNHQFERHDHAKRKFNECVWVSYSIQ